LYTIEDTPLHLAVRLRNKGIVRLLLAYGAKGERKNREKYTPLDLATNDADMFGFMQEILRSMMVRVEFTSDQ
jgi:ankyrin repeat protein